MAFSDGQPHAGLFYTDALGALIQAVRARTYLEVGVQNGFNLSKIAVDTAIGVDPDLPLSVNPMQGKRALHLFQETSDAFFASPSAWVWGGKIEVAFLDGMHLFEYLLRDIFNTEAMSDSRGIIALHDCMPFNVGMAARENRPELRSGPHAAAWTGDVWKVVPIIRKYRPDLRVTMLDCQPTGLVCLSRLNARSTELREQYDAILAEFDTAPNDEASIASFYRENRIVSAAQALADIEATFFT
jgi:hypothetical protein